MQVIEESKSEAFMTAKVDDPVQRREQMAVDLRKSKRRDILSKKGRTWGSIRSSWKGQDTPSRSSTSPTKRKSMDKRTSRSSQHGRLTNT